MRKYLAFVVFIVLSSVPVCARGSLNLDIETALEMGRTQSLMSMESRTALQVAYWQYRNYRADFFPSLTLESNMPSLNRSLSSYQQEDGRYKFVPNNYISEDIGLMFNQVIPFTGGQVYLESSIQRIDQLGYGGTGSFLTIPFTLTLVQPVFSYNPYKWSRMIEPLKYENSKSEYAASVEQVNISTVTHYFNLLISMSNVEIARQNRKNAGDLYEIAVAKQQLGTISDDEVMQLHVGLLNADANLINAEHDYSEKMGALRTYLGIEDDTEIIPSVPEEKHISAATADVIRNMALSNNPIYKEFKIRLLEAESNVIKAKRERGPDVEVYVSVGNTGSDYGFTDSYSNLQNRQIAQIGISIPILDWGKRRGKYELAKSQYSLVENRIAREEAEFDENLKNLVDNIGNIPKLVEIYETADSVAQERYKIALERFTLGDISVIDINYAEQEKDNARRKYINQLYLSWLYYYELRYVTLFDFESGSNLGNVDPEELF